VCESEIAQMVPFFERVRAEGKRLLIRGKLAHEDLGLLREEISPDGLYIQIVIERPEESRRFREFFQPWYRIGVRDIPFETNLS
jgi:hypothetical protein